jgi:hypothetical protein
LRASSDEESQKALWIAVVVVGLGLTGFAIWITTGVFALFPAFLAMGAVIALALAGAEDQDAAMSERPRESGHEDVRLGPCDQEVIQWQTDWTS